MFESVTSTQNPLLNLDYEPCLEHLGDDYFDIVTAAEFPAHHLRFRNDALLHRLGLDPTTVSDRHFVEAFGQFAQAPRPFLALKYHGHQFGEYNEFLGDGRGFLYGQVRGCDGKLYDFGTKGSGTTPYSRGGDGRLTLKGGVREVLAAEALHRLGVRTSRCLSLVETGESLWRGDEPSPTRSAVMVRMNETHIRFGTFERLHYHGRKDLIRILLDHVIEQYYPQLATAGDRDARFYAELVQRVATLTAQWMVAGFCHAVLNTDNMSIAGESFDYGPYAFIPSYNLRFTAAYFDYFGRYCYGNQPQTGQWNLARLQVPLKLVMAADDLDAGLASYGDHYRQAYRQGMMHRLGFGTVGYDHIPAADADQLVERTVVLLQESQVGYGEFFATLRQQFQPDWRQDASLILADAFPPNDDIQALATQWRQAYQHCLNLVAEAELAAIARRLRLYNPLIVLVRPEIEAVWDAIAVDNNWVPFQQLVQRLQDM